MHFVVAYKKITVFNISHSITHPLPRHSNPLSILPSAVNTSPRTSSQWQMVLSRYRSDQLDHLHSRARCALPGSFLEGSGLGSAERLLPWIERKMEETDWTIASCLLQVMMGCLQSGEGWAKPILPLCKERCSSSNVVNQAHMQTRDTTNHKILNNILL